MVLLSTLALFVAVAITAWVHSQVHLDIQVRPVPPPARPRAPRISVIVPARNEARNIRRCVLSLLAQDYPDYELIVVDDRSTDATPHILAEIQKGQGSSAGRLNGPNERAPDPPPQMKVIQGEELPSGWAGKPHALAQGASAATGEWLCFVDADTFAAPGLLTATFYCAQAQQADLFTILTGQELGSFWEKTILPLIFTALSVGFPARKVNDPSRPEAIANGQFILIDRSVYESAGGHAAIRERIDEDKALAERVKRSGHRLVIADGREVASTRMYTSFAEIWEGWTKNIFLGMRDRLGLLLFGAVVGLLGALALPLWLLAGIVWYATTGSLAAAVVATEAGLAWAYLLWKRVQAARAFGISPFYALTLPLGALVFTAMMFASAFLVLSGKGVRWKGRRYNL